MGLKSVESGDTQRAAAFQSRAAKREEKRQTVEANKAEAQNRAQLSQQKRELRQAAESNSKSKFHEQRAASIDVTA